MVGIVAAVAAVEGFPEVVVDTLAPESGLIHHQVALAAVEFCRGAVGDVVRVCIIVGVFIMQREVGHLTVEVIHGGLDIGDGDFSGRWFAGDLGKTAVALGEYRRDVSARHIVGAGLIAGTIVKVGYAAVIGHIDVALDGGVLGLTDIQLGEVCTCADIVPRRCNVSSAPYPREHRYQWSSVGINAAHRHEFVEPCAIVLPVDAGDTETVDVGTS